jgi:hypothetical protein
MYDTLGKCRKTFPNWNVKARSELTPNVILAETLRTSKKNPTQLLITVKEVGK